MDQHLESSLGTLATSGQEHCELSICVIRILKNEGDISSTGSSVAVFLIWDLSTSVSLLYLFSIFYGLFAGLYSSRWSAIIHEIQGKMSRAETEFSIGAVGCG